jgi:hypothetical protein
MCFLQAIVFYQGTIRHAVAVKIQVAGVQIDHRKLSHVGHVGNIYSH